MDRGLIGMTCQCMDEKWGT